MTLDFKCEVRNFTRDFAGLVSFLWQCYLAWRKAGKVQDQGIYYFAVSQYGVPTTTVMIGRGRSAYVVSNYASNYFADNPKR